MLFYKKHLNINLIFLRQILIKKKLKYFFLFGILNHIIKIYQFLEIVKKKLK
jgi:hypothetical protein